MHALWIGPIVTLCYATALFSINYQVVAVRYMYMIWWSVLIGLLLALCAVQLRAIENLFRRQFVLLKKQLQVQDKLDIEKQRSDQVCDCYILTL